MDKQVEQFYKSYQKNSDTSILQAHYILTSKLKDQKKLSATDLFDVNNQLTAIKEVIKERKLKVRQQGKDNIEFDAYMKSGFKSLVIGLVVSIVSIVLMSWTQRNTIFLLTLVIGGGKFIQGAIELGMGLFVRVFYADRF